MDTCVCICFIVPTHQASLTLALVPRSRYLPDKEVMILYTVWNGDLTGFTCLHLSFLGETISWIMVAKSAWPRHGDIGWYWCSHVFTVFARLSEFGLIHPHCGQSSMNNPYGSSRTFWGSIWAMMWGLAVLFSGSVWIHRKDTIFNAVYKVYI